MNWKRGGGDGGSKRRDEGKGRMHREKKEGTAGKERAKGFRPSFGLWHHPCTTGTDSGGDRHG
jgi:hypothetical protein